MEPPSFAKEATKVFEGPLVNVSEASKDSKKRARGFLNVKSSTAKALEHAQNLEKNHQSRRNPTLQLS